MENQPELTPTKIKELRRGRKMSQEALAQLLGVSTSTVIRWEQGTANPTGTAATILLAMLTGPLVAPIAIGAMVGLGPWALSAYGIYRALKDVFEAEPPQQDEAKKTPSSQ